jgi:hypothetical protein
MVRIPTANDNLRFYGILVPESTRPVVRDLLSEGATDTIPGGPISPAPTTEPTQPPHTLQRKH